MSHNTVYRNLSEESATATLGAELSFVARAGDTVLLTGGLGSGKTTLARGFIGALQSAGSVVEVPSPTFPILQIYEEGRLPVVHFDLYRLKHREEVAELGYDDLVATHVVLVEWPELLNDSLPVDRLVVTLEQEGDGRRAIIEGHGNWGQRLHRLEAARKFLESGEWKDSERKYFEGDASTRRYERLRSGHRRAVLMDMPARPDGPVVRNGKSYSAVAHLAENVRSVVAITEALLARGISAARIFSTAMDQGFLVIEDLGDKLYGRMMRGREDISEAMTMAVTLLADIAGMDWPEVTPLPDGSQYRLCHYDQEALEIEVELLLDWFWPLAKGTEVDSEARGEFLRIWRTLWPIVMRGKRVWTLRDYHSPNLLWLPERQGTARVGVIDTQDAVLGHPAYDLASMLQDARVYVTEATTLELLDFYCAYRSAAESDFDESDFRNAFLILSTQRLTKILGIFARLSTRDGKPEYLKHLTTLNRYLESNFREPVLAELKNWYDRHLSPDIRERAGVAR